MRLSTNMGQEKVHAFAATLPGRPKQRILTLWCGGLWFLSALLPQLLLLANIVKIQGRTCSDRDA
jgi:hypothetical protein